MSQVVILTFLTDSSRLVRYPGAYQIAWYIRQHGYDSQVLDFLYFMTEEQRLNLYKKYITSETKIVGWAPFLMGTTQNLENGLKLCIKILEEIKENFPWVKIIVGGKVVRWFLHQGHKLVSFKVDAVFDGESEYSFLSYCDYIFKNNPHPNFQLVNNIKVVKPSESYDISKCKMRFEERDFVLSYESLPLELSRGCIFKCKFCQFPNIGKDKDDFNRSIDVIKETLIYHYENFGITRYHISDDTLNSHRERTKQFYEMTKTLSFKIEYLGYVRLDLLDIWPEQQDILPESGLISCHFGIESLNPESCRLIGKGWGAKNHKTWLPKIKNYWGNNVIISCSFIAGLGKETKKDWDETLNWLMQSDIDDYLYIPLHLDSKLMASEFEKNASKYGYRWPNPINDPGEWVSDYTSKKETADWCREKILIYREKVIPGAWNYASYRNQGFTKEEIMAGNYFTLNRKKIQNKTTEKFVNDYYQKAISYDM